jgi:hypothetical protein
VRDEEIGRVLGGEEDVLPSSGFHASVMEVVHREATVPPPIPFPWKRAWPAFAAAALALVGSLVLLVRSGAAEPLLFESLIPAAKIVGAPWVALAALATAGSLLLSRRLADERY